MLFSSPRLFPRMFLLAASGLMLALPAAAQPMDNEDNSSYPSSNQRSGTPNEPDQHVGNPISTYRAPRAPSGTAPLGGMGGSQQPQVIFDGSVRNGVPGNQDIDPSQTSGSNTVIAVPVPARR